MKSHPLPQLIDFLLFFYSDFPLYCLIPPSTHALPIILYRTESPLRGD